MAAGGRDLHKIQMKNQLSLLVKNNPLSKKINRVTQNWKEASLVWLFNFQELSHNLCLPAAMVAGGRDLHKIQMKNQLLQLVKNNSLSKKKISRLTLNRKEASLVWLYNFQELSLNQCLPAAMVDVGRDLLNRPLFRTSKIQNLKDLNLDLLSLSQALNCLPAVIVVKNTSVAKNLIYIFDVG